MHQARIGTEDRQRALDLLSRALELGYLRLDEFEQRMVAINGATYATEVAAQFGDLPPEFQWRIDAAAEPTSGDANARALAIGALTLGIASIVLAVCVVGGLFGVAGLALSFLTRRNPNGHGMAMIGRVLSVIGILLSLIVLAIALFAPEPATP